jgi:hypothetical protein
MPCVLRFMEWYGSTDGFAKLREAESRFYFSDPLSVDG